MKEKVIEVLLSNQNEMYRRAYFLCKNMADAEDLVSDSNLKILAMIEKEALTIEHAFRGYFLSVVNTLFIDKLRENKRSPITLKSETIHLQPAHTQDYIGGNEIKLSEIMKTAKIEADIQPIFEVFLSGVNMDEYSKQNSLKANTVRGIIHRTKYYLNRKKHRFEYLKDGFDLVTNEKILPTNKKLAKVKPI